jgi:DNA adenine methylase
MRDASPLRYPGGKWRVTPFFERILSRNGLKNCLYVEPYAGGASLALSLLFSGHVAEIHLNDLDAAVHAFWDCVLKRNREFVQLLGETPVNPEEWRRQKAIYAAGPAAGMLALGFATFFLNRTNHSGILNGGMIGGKKQAGEWRLDARFNRPELERRIKRIGAFKTRIHLSRSDAVEFLRGQDLPARSFVYLDPPYYRAGRDLYLNAYKPSDHLAVRQCVETLTTPWIVSYDDVPEIRKLYKNVKSRCLTLLHTARSARPGKEVLFFAPELKVPRCCLS